MATEEMKDQVQQGVDKEVDKQEKADNTGTGNEIKLGVVGSFGQRLMDADKKRAEKKLKKQEAKAAKKQAKAEKGSMPIAGKIGVAAAVVGAALGGAAIYISNKNDDKTVELKEDEIRTEPAAIPELTAVQPAEDPIPVIEEAAS